MTIKINFIRGFQVFGTFFVIISNRSVTFVIRSFVAYLYENVSGPYRERAEEWSHVSDRWPCTA
jgi:hypothetical protein